MIRKYTRFKLQREQLEKLYWDQELSMSEIAKKIKTSSSMVHWYMKKWSIPMRNKSSALKLGIKRGRVHRFIGEDNPRWKGGKFISKDGYIGIKMPTHPRANSLGYVSEHLFIWEQSNGKSLPEGWIIHHLNGNRHDNRPENLLAMPRKSHHYALLLQGLRKRIRQLEATLAQIKAQGNLWKGGDVAGE